MARSEHLSLIVSVVGLSGCGADVYKGPGKSSLCFNLLYPTEYLKEHPSVLTLEQFESKVIDKQHYVYWGSKTEYYHKLPKSKKSTEKILVTVNFEIFEQTEFIENITKKSFPISKEYPERAMKLPRSSNKLAFKTTSLVCTPEKYHAAVSPSTRGVRNGYIFAIDVSKDCPTFYHQVRLLKKMVKPHKKLFVIAATKFDKVDSQSFEEVKIAGKELNVEVIPTSIEMEDGRWGTEVFKYLAIKLFNLHTEDTTGMAGDSYLRYATEPPPTSAPKKKVEHMPNSVEDHFTTPPIPPRNYGLEGMLSQSLPESCFNHDYGNFVRQPTDQTSDGNAAITESRVTEIPPKLKARKPQTLNQRAVPVLPTLERNSVPMESLSEASSAPPLPPKPRSSSLPKSPGTIPVSPMRNLPKSPGTIPVSPIQKPSTVPQKMAARPLPKLPFVGDVDENTDNFSGMRCDYDKIDYGKMTRYRSKFNARQSKLNPKLSSSNVTVPARNIPRYKEGAPTSSKEFEKRKPPPVAKKPTVKPRKQGVTTSATTEKQCDAPSFYEDTVVAPQTSSEYDDTAYVNEGEDKLTVPSNSDRPKYPPRCIPRKYYFLNAPRALPT